MLNFKSSLASHMHVTSYLSLPWTNPCISVKWIFLNHSTYEIPFWLKNLQWFPIFHWVEYTCLALTYKACSKLPFQVHLLQFYCIFCFTLLLCFSESRFFAFSVSADPKIGSSVLSSVSKANNLRGLSLTFCAWNTTMKYYAVFPRHFPGSESTFLDKSANPEPSRHPAGEWVSFAYRDQELSKWFYWAAPRPWRREGS